MPDSVITVSDLVATSVASGVQLTYETADPYSTMDYLRLDAVEVHASPANNRAIAPLVAEGDASGALHTALTAGATWYYWIRPRNRAGGYGDWYPASDTAGVSVTVYSDSATWVVYNPVVSAETGTVTSWSASGRYKIIGKTCFVITVVNVDDNGDAATSLRVTMPFSCSFSNASVGVFIRNDHVMGVAYVTGSAVSPDLADIATLYLYDGTFPLRVSPADTNLNISVSFELP